MVEVCEEKLRVIGFLCYKSMSGAKAAYSVQGSPFGAIITASPLLADFHELRQGFSPPIPAITSNPTQGIGRRMRKINHKQ